jgi:hypothetical protein
LGTLDLNYATGFEPDRTTYNQLIQPTDCTGLIQKSRMPPISPPPCRCQIHSTSHPSPILAPNPQFTEARARRQHRCLTVVHISAPPSTSASPTKISSTSDVPPSYRRSMRCHLVPLGPLRCRHPPPTNVSCARYGPHLLHRQIGLHRRRSCR